MVSDDPMLSQLRGAGFDAADTQPNRPYHSMPFFDTIRRFEHVYLIPFEVRCIP
jgi:hypothetical protein